jgi:hypothetical protein
MPLQCIYLHSTIQQLLTNHRSLLKQLPIIQYNSPKLLVLQHNQLLTQCSLQRNLQQLVLLQ